MHQASSGVTLRKGLVVVIGPPTISLRTSGRHRVRIVTGGLDNRQPAERDPPYAGKLPLQEYDRDGLGLDFRQRTSLVVIGSVETSIMGATIDAVKALIVPAVIALILFIVTNFVLLPLWRHYQLRYSQYIPVQSITDRTSSARIRMQAFMARWLVPSNWRRARVERGGDADDEEDGLSEDLDFLSVDGEELGRVYAGAGDVGGRHALSLDAHGGNQVDSASRLSRDLEQGFRDDSDDDEDEESDPRQRR
ncbi:hypothetical protein MN608_06317 [Microdochium nivale]|nr:hypothetical protein MN608_06317 [Microdochium nivale]